MATQLLKRFIAFGIAVAIVISLFVTDTHDTQAQGSGAYDFFQYPITASTCTTSSVSASLTEIYNHPIGSVIWVSGKLNGTPTGPAIPTVTIIGGPGSITTTLLGPYGVPLPFISEAIFELRVNGVLVTRSTVIWNCTASGHTVTIVNETFGTSVPSQPTSAPQYWNPGDNRVDPRPGDRLAVWCNQPGKLVVYGIDNNGKGFLLTTFNNMAILTAGSLGVTKNLGANGTVSVSEDSQGNFWLAWNGGQWNADGQPNHGFAKGISCDFTKTTKLLAQLRAEIIRKLESFFTEDDFENLMELMQYAHNAKECLIGVAAMVLSYTEGVPIVAPIGFPDACSDATSEILQMLGSYINPPPVLAPAEKPTPPG